MGLVWHQLRKDLRALRWMVAVWLWVLAFGVGSMTLTSAWGGPGGGLAFALIDYLISTLDTIAVVVMVPLLIHQEPLVGTKGAWLTRPMARTQLLASKVLFILAVILVPSLLAEAAALASNQIPTDYIGLAVVEGLLFRCALVVPVAALAALTPGFARFAVWGAGAWMLWTAVGSALAVSQLLGGDPMAVVSEMPLWEARRILGSLVLVVCGVAVLVHQYLTRRTRVSAALAGAGVLFFVGVQGFWPWPLHGAAEPAAPHEAPDVELSLTPDSLWVRDAVSFSFGASRPRQKQVSGQLRCSGAPPGTFCQLDSLSGELRFDDGTEVPIEKASGFTIDRVDSDALSAVLDADVDGGSAALAGYQELFQLDRGIVDSHGRRPATLEATASIRLRRYRVVAELPLTPGARFVRGPRQTRLEQVLEGPRSRDVVFVETRLQLSLFEREPRPMLASMLDPTLYALLNRPRQQALLPEIQPSFDPSAALLSQRRLRKSVLTRSFDSEGQLGQPYFAGIDDAWFSQARLAVIEVEELGLRHTRLNAAEIVLDPLERRRPASNAQLPGRAKRSVSLAEERLAAGSEEEALRHAAEALEIDLSAAGPLADVFGEDPEFASLRERATSRIDGLLAHYERRWGRHLARDEASALWAIWSLGTEHRDAEAVPFLVRFLTESPSEEARWRAADALWLIGDRSAAPQLVVALEDPSLKVRGFAASALGDLGDRDAVPAILAMFESLEDNREEAKARAADALGKLGDPRGIAPLADSLERIRDPEYVRWAEPALRRLREGNP